MAVLQGANVGAQSRHRPETDHLLAIRAGAQPRPAVGEIDGDLFALVGKDSAVVRRLQGIPSIRRSDGPLDTCHGRNLTVPLDRCHSGHMFAVVGPSDGAER